MLKQEIWFITWAHNNNNNILSEAVQSSSRMYWRLSIILFGLSKINWTINCHGQTWPHDNKTCHCDISYSSSLNRPFKTLFIDYDVLIGCFWARVRNSNSTVLWPITPQPYFELSAFESTGFECNYTLCITSIDVILRSCHNNNICCNSKQHFQFSF